MIDPLVLVILLGEAILDVLVLARLVKLRVLDDVVSNDVTNDDDMLVLVRLIVLDDVIRDDVITVLDGVIAGDENTDDGVGTEVITEELLVLVAIVLLVMLGEGVAAAVVVVVVEATTLKLVVVGTDTQRLLFLEYPSAQPSHASPL